MVSMNFEFSKNVKRTQLEEKAHIKQQNNVDIAYFVIVTMQPLFTKVLDVGLPSFDGSIDYEQEICIKNSYHSA